VYTSIVNLIIDADLSEPPSEIHAFRDVTLYGKIYIFEDILLRCEVGTKTLYWNWLKQHGAHDFISYLITDLEEESGVHMSSIKGGILISKICSFNLAKIISLMNSYR
jgi:hypothetical protein